MIVKISLGRIQAKQGAGDQVWFVSNFIFSSAIFTLI